MNTSSSKGLAGERKLPDLPARLYIKAYHVTRKKMEHSVLYYFGIAFVAIGLVKLAQAAYRYFRK